MRMGFFDWVKNIFIRPTLTVAPESVDPDNADLATLDIPGAVQAHLNWTKRLRDAIQGESQEDFDISAVRADHNCALGKWIHSDGERAYGELPAFTDLRAKHAHFHREAAGVLEAVEAGERTHAQRQLVTSFSASSREVIAALDLLQDQALMRAARAQGA